MSRTQTQQRPQAMQEQPLALLDQVIDNSTTVVYRPLGESEEIKLSLNLIRKYLCLPTKKGIAPTDQDVMTYMMVCRQRSLNPWAKDCYLTGYDTQDGPKFSIIVAVQAMFKRAEINEHFDGVESGVVVESGGQVIDRAGDFWNPPEQLIGGWARIWRKDRKLPFYQRLTVQAYRKQSPFWTNDPAGQIAKCAEAGALRQAFPSDVGGLYLREEMLEMGLISSGTSDTKPTSLEGITATLIVPPKQNGDKPKQPKQPADDGPPRDYADAGEADAGDQIKATGTIDTDLLDLARMDLLNAADETAISHALDGPDGLYSKPMNDATREAIAGLAFERRKALRGPTGRDAVKSQKELVQK